MTAPEQDRPADHVPVRHRRVPDQDQGVLARLGASGRHRLARIGGAPTRPGSDAAEADLGLATQLGVAVLGIGLLMLGALFGALTELLGAWGLALVAAALLAAVGLAFTRILVTAVIAPRTFRANVATALLGSAGVFLAVGAVQAAGLVLWVYQPDFDDAQRAAIADGFAAIDGLADRRSTVQARIDFPPPAPVDGDPDVDRAQKAFDSKNVELTQAEKGLVCEATGRCGTLAGQGAGYRTRRDTTVKRLRGERDDLDDELKAAVAAAQARRMRAQQEQDRAELARVDQQLASLQAAQDERVRRADPSNRGLQAQRGRLGALSGVRTLRAIGWTFVAGLVVSAALQLAPVVLKLVCGSSPADDSALRERYRLDEERRRASADRGKASSVSVPAQTSATTSQDAR